MGLYDRGTPPATFPSFWANWKAILAGVFGLFVLLTVLDGVYTVDESERAVVLSFGSATWVAEPGLGFKVPYIQSIVRMSARTEKVIRDNMDTYSKDQQQAEIRVAVNYRLDPVRMKEIYGNFGASGIASSYLEPRIFAATKNVFGDFTAETAIQERPRLNREVSDFLVKLVEGSGIIIEGVMIEDIQFSKQYIAAVEERMKAQVEVERLRQQLQQDQINAQRLEVTSTAEANAQRAKAKAEADSIEMRGKAEALAIKARSDAIADNPALIALTTAEKWDGKLPATMLPNGSVPFIQVPK